MCLGIGPYLITALSRIYEDHNALMELLSLANTAKELVVEMYQEAESEVVTDEKGTRFVRMERVCEGAAERWIKALEPVLKLVDSPIHRFPYR